MTFTRPACLHSRQAIQSIADRLNPWLYHVVVQVRFPLSTERFSRARKLTRFACRASGAAAASHSRPGRLPYFASCGLPCLSAGTVPLHSRSEQLKNE